MYFKLGCSLAYWMNAPTSFVFNIEAQTFGEQVVEDEALTITPHCEPERWTMPESGNRYFRVNAPSGKLVVDYTARVKWTPVLEDPEQVTEVELSRLPLSVFIHLYPSRYCQSDKLERFARSTFGKLDPGYARVNGVLQLDSRLRVLRGRIFRRADVGIRHRHAAGRRLSRFRAPRHRALSHAWHPGAICQRLCVSPLAARFSRRVRSVSGGDPTGAAGTCSIPPVSRTPPDSSA